MIDFPDRMWQVFAHWGSTLVDEKNVRKVRDAMHDMRDQAREDPLKRLGWEMVKFTDLTGAEHEVQISSLTGYCETSVEIKARTRDINEALSGRTEDEPWNQ